MQDEDRKDAMFEIDHQIGSRIRHRRVLLGMTQDQLGAKIGISYQQIQKYETGANRVSTSRLFQISKVLDIDISWFYQSSATSTLDNEMDANIPSRHVIELVRNFSLIEHEKLQLTVLSLVKTLAAREMEAMQEKKDNRPASSNEPPAPAS